MPAGVSKFLTNSVLLIEQRAIVAMLLYRNTQPAGGFIAPLVPSVAKSHPLNAAVGVGHPHKMVAPAARADQAKADPVVCAEHARGRRRSRRAHQKTASGLHSKPPLILLCQTSIYQGMILRIYPVGKV